MGTSNPRGDGASVVPATATAPSGTAAPAPGRGATRGSGAGRSPGRAEPAIYGVVLTAGLLAAQDPRHEPLAQMVSDVLVTVVVFWLAHGYAHALSRPLDPALTGTETASTTVAPPSRPVPARWSGLRQAGTALAVNWPLARACLLPVLALVLARLVGVSGDDAQEVALWSCVALLTLWGYRAGHAAGLDHWRLARYTAGSALLGIALVVLEVAIH